MNNNSVLVVRVCSSTWSSLSTFYWIFWNNCITNGVSKWSTIAVSIKSGLTACFLLLARPPHLTDQWQLLDSLGKDMGHGSSKEKGRAGEHTGAAGLAGLGGPDLAAMDAEMSRLRGVDEDAAAEIDFLGQVGSREATMAG